MFENQKKKENMEIKDSFLHKSSLKGRLDIEFTAY